MHEAGSFSRKHIDNEIKLGGLLHWDVARLRPMQNLVDEFGGATKEVRQVWSIIRELQLELSEVDLRLIARCLGHRRREGLMATKRARIAFGIARSMPLAGAALSPNARHRA